jgi:hypothetical protein
METKIREFDWTDDAGTDRKLYIRKPTAEEMDRAKYEYTKVYNEALSENIMPKTALKNRLEESGVNLTEMERVASEKFIEINDLIDELEEARKKEDKSLVHELKSKMSIIRADVTAKRTVIRDYLANCADTIAEDARDSYLTANIIMEDGKALIDSTHTDLKKAMKERYDKYRKDEYSSLRRAAEFHFVTLQYGLDPDFLEKLPERQKESWETQKEDKAEESKE